MHAVCARHHNLPFYVAAPLSTFDPVHSMDEIVIEERDRSEVSTCGNRTTVPDKAEVYNPAFDMTPVNLVSAIITEKGIVRPQSGLKAFINSQMIR